MYYKMETLAFDTCGDEHMEADVPFAQMQIHHSFEVQVQDNLNGYQPMNDYDVQMDDEEETKSVCDNMLHLRYDNLMGGQSDYGPENPQSDDPFAGNRDAMDRLANDSWLKLRHGTYETFDLNFHNQQFNDSMNVSDMMSAGNESARRLSNLEAERNLLEKDKITIMVEGTAQD